MTEIATEIAPEIATAIDQAAVHPTPGHADRQLRSHRRRLLAGPAAAIGCGLLLLAAPGQGQTTVERPAADAIGNTQQAAFRKESTMTQLAQAEPASATAAAIRPFRVDIPGARNTETYRITNDRTIVGGYTGQDRRIHGYIGDKDP